jgi:hypothetical protein
VAQARPDVENQVGTKEPRDKESFLKIIMIEAKRQLYPGCTKIFKVLICGKASAYEAII